MGVKDLIKKMEDLAAEASSDAAPSHKAPAPAAEPAVAKRADAPPMHNSQPVAEEMTGPACSASATDGPAKENGAQLPAAAAPGKEPEDPEKKAKKVEEYFGNVIPLCAVPDVIFRRQLGMLRQLGNG